MMAAPTENGIYCDVTEADYASWPHLRRSHLVKGFESMKKLRAAWDGVSDPQTEAQRFGVAFHARILQPRLYESTYAAMPGFAQDEPGRYKNYKASKEYKLKAAAFGAAHEGKDILAHEDAAAIERMADAVHANPIAKLLKSGGGVECAITWEAEGVPLKIRTDLLVGAVGQNQRDRPVIIDLKKEGRSAAPWSFRSALWRYRYDVQAAMAIDAVKDTTGKDADFMFVVVEDSAPHEVVVYQPGAATIDGARREYHSILQRIKWCEAHGIWPGLGYDYELEDYQVQPIDVPQWKLDEYEQEAAI
jgi:hypothetical protein